MELSRCKGTSTHSRLTKGGVLFINGPHGGNSKYSIHKLANQRVGEATADLGAPQKEASKWVQLAVGYGRILKKIK